MIEIDMVPQPDDTSCGPTCLSAIYRHFGDAIAIEDVRRDVPQLEDGGTLAVILGEHALRRGYEACLYTLNLAVFDPTWFEDGASDLSTRLVLQMQVKPEPRLQAATAAYLRFLELGGEIRFEDLDRVLLERLLGAGEPVLTGLSSTYLYRTARERPHDDEADDIAGCPVGHFVVLCGFDPADRNHVIIADPLHPNPMSPGQKYCVSVDRLMAAVLLGVLTYDANMLVIRRPSQGEPA